MNYSPSYSAPWFVRQPEQERNFLRIFVLSFVLIISPKQSGEVTYTQLVNENE